MANTTHKVVKGDTLSAIAKKYGVKLADLIAANPAIKNPSMIKVGQVVNVPAKAGAQQQDSTTSGMAVPVSMNSPVSEGKSDADIDARLAGFKLTDKATAGVTQTTPNPNLYNADLPQDTLSMESLSAKFSIAASILKSDPSLVKVLYKIMGMDETGTKKISGAVVDPELQLAMLKNTDWYLKNTEDWRKFQYAKESDPMTYQADLRNNAEKITTNYFKAGIKIDAATAVKLAEQAMMKSAVVDGKVITYNDKYFAQMMADSIDFSSKKTLPNGKVVYDLDGNLETVAQGLYTLAYDYGYDTTVSNDQFTKWLESTTKGIVAGTINQEDIDDQLQKQAMSAYPGLADQLTQGKTLREAANPWLKALADEWEVDTSQIDLKDDYLYKALNSQDDKGNISPMNLYQTKVMARKSSKWQYTGKAKEEYTNIGQKILQDFGFLG